MSRDEERYLHLHESVWSLNEAWAILKELHPSPRGGVIHAAAYRYALIAYVRPFTRSDGKFQHGRNPYKLPRQNLSPECLALHDSLLALRDQVLAHSDLTVKQASVYVSTAASPYRTIIGSNGAPDFPEIQPVIDLVERTLDLLSVEYAEAEAKLTPNG